MRICITMSTVHKLIYHCHYNAVRVFILDCMLCLNYYNYYHGCAGNLGLTICMTNHETTATYVWLTTVMTHIGLTMSVSPHNSTREQLDGFR